MERLTGLAGRQEGRVTRAQLNLCGVDNTTIARWIQTGRLFPRLPRVFALGYVATDLAARLWEAVLYAGPGAMVTHMTAAQWRGYIKYAPAQIHVSTPRKIASLPSVVVHPRRQLERVLHNGVPTATPGQVMLDLAVERPDLLPRALGQLDYLEGLNKAVIAGVCHNGALGSIALRAALDDYDPAYARLNDVFEIDFYELCRSWHIDPLPLPNVEVAPKLIVDALWPEHNLAVELDGGRNHSSDGQLLKDAERDLICRSLGLTVIRYRRAQITRSPERVRIDLVTQLERHAARMAA